MTIALLCSVPAEADLLRQNIARMEATSCGMKPIFAGNLAGQEIALCIGGMGKANAAHAATLLITRFSPEVLFIFGVGGAYPSSGARVGDIAVAKAEIAGDEGVLTPCGYQDAESIGIPLLKTATSVIYSTYPASEHVLVRVKKTLGETVYEGSFVTLSTCTGTSVRAAELEARHHGLCENMEGAAAAHVAICQGVPWIEVRGISNIVEDRDLKKWNIPKAAEAAQRSVMRILQRWND